VVDAGADGGAGWIVVVVDTGVVVIIAGPEGRAMPGCICGWAAVGGTMVVVGMGAMVGSKYGVAGGG